MTAVSTLRDRARSPTVDELDSIPWLKVLDAADQRHVAGTIMVAHAHPGDRICRVGRPPTYWFGVVEGLLKMSNDSKGGAQITFTGIPPGAWFGEGTLLKREVYRYNIEALRRSTVAGLPIDEFHGLLDRGVYIAPALYEAGFVSAAHGDADIEQTIAAAKDVFQALSA